MSSSDLISRRAAVQSLGALGLLSASATLLPAESTSAEGVGSPQVLRPDANNVVALEVAEQRVRLAGRMTTVTAINGTVPGPLIRLREGDDAILRVTNRLREDTSIHWHGILLPPEMDGVPGISFDGISPGETFEYRFPLHQSGTYWYHSHSGLQEQLGHYGALVVDSAESDQTAFDREFVVVLSDWTFEDPYRILARLKKQPDYFNYQRRTLVDLLRDVAQDGLAPTLRDRLMWSSMRMNPTDLTDITGSTLTYLLNGQASSEPWTGVFTPGERVRLRIINAGATTYFDLRVPGVAMTVVEASGQPVQPVETDELRIAIAETYDVILTLPEDRPYALYAEAMDRSGFVFGSLTPRAAEVATPPPRRKRAILTMADMGMAHGAGGMAGMDHGAMSPRPAAAPAPMDDEMDHSAHEDMAPGTAGGLRPPGTLPEPSGHGPDTHGVGNAMVPENLTSRLSEPGTGLGDDGRRVLVYTDLQARAAWPEFRAPDREVELHLTGNMERFIWAIDGVPFHKAAPIEFTFGERIRLTMVNDTMMNHPMHLHGMWMYLENGHGDRSPRVHTVNVKPAERVSLLVTADAPGRWAFHCHVLYHMEVGMFREVRVSAPMSNEEHAAAANV